MSEQSERAANKWANLKGCPDCGAVYSMMEVGGITNWGCDNAFHSRGRTVQPAAQPAVEGTSDKSLSRRLTAGDDDAIRHEEVGSSPTASQGKTLTSATSSVEGTMTAELTNECLDDVEYFKLHGKSLDWLAVKFVGRASRKLAEANAEIELDVDAIYRVATGALDRGTPVERMEYIAETCQIVLSRLRGEKEK